MSYTLEYFWILRHDGVTCSSSLGLFVQVFFFVWQSIIFNSSLSVECGSLLPFLWPDNLHLSLLIVCLSSPIPSTLFPSIHPSPFLFIQSDGVGPTYRRLSVEVNAHTRMSPYTPTWCLPLIYLTECLHSLAPNWPLAGQMDGWPTVFPLSPLPFLPHKHLQSQKHTMTVWPQDTNMSVECFIFSVIYLKKCNLFV